MSPHPAVLLDRDGVVTEPVRDPRLGTPESPLNARDVALVPGAADAITELRARGWALAVCSNQPAAAKGHVAFDELEAVHDRAVELLGDAADAVDGWFYCPHHPDGTVALLARQCSCRKPAPGLLHDAAAALDIDLAVSWMVGDADRDVQAGRAAGCRTALIEHPGSAHRRGGDVQPDVRVTDLSALVPIIGNAR